ncbi:MAG: hypothetical protein UT37_C0005G0020 [Parcubacteria group bacterium GW2011_GWA2_39_18]|nr:MAG: hypothetical protein UT37_C0005G0020 [Parcubacteria group bacterium GW2011_GWA2_39_18]
MSRASKSYLNRRRPPIVEAMKLEGNVSMDEALKSLEQKGYFTPRPRPWRVGFRDRGLGRGDFAVLDRFGDLVAEISSKEDAELIVSAVNAKKDDKE